ncbi:MAG TPA: T9SS type A sorting domain-containing protein [Flavobacteriales bacterium]|nr:T9SS type A sorting domain-containing protein [Flavobacteriales bacterium]
MSNNSATHTLTNAAGCDSVVTLNLTINTVDSSVTQNGIILTADAAGAGYQWLDCDNSFSIISGETNQSFTTTANGNFAVEITLNGCVDTSACYSVTSVGIIENSFGNGLLIYPNPTGGNFSIDLGSNYQTVTITMTDVNGKVILSKTYNESQLLNLKLEEPAGVYLLIIESKDKKAVIRLVKE